MKALALRQPKKWDLARPERISMKKPHINYILLGFFALILIPFATMPNEARYTQSNEAVPASAVAEWSDGDRLDVYLSRLAFTYECPKRCADAVRRGQLFKIKDSNGLFSYGCLQFQEATWIAMAHRYGVDPWENGGIANCDNQLRVAKMMFEADPVAAANHWYTSIYVKGLGLPKS